MLGKNPRLFSKWDKQEKSYAASLTIMGTQTKNHRDTQQHPSEKGYVKHSDNTVRLEDRK